MPGGSIHVDKVIEASANTDENDVAYVTLTVSERRSEEEITIRMTVDQADAIAAELSEAQSEAVEKMNEAGYTEWPPRFILPIYPQDVRKNDKRRDLPE